MVVKESKLATRKNKSFGEKAKGGKEKKEIQMYKNIGKTRGGMANLENEETARVKRFTLCVRRCKFIAISMNSTL